jgi:Family of unknown function (DUF5681)
MARGGNTRWPPGQSGNPSGRRKGTVLAATAVRKLIEDASVEIIEKQIALAKKGSPLVARFLLEKILPAARSAPITAPVQLDGSPTEQAEQIVALLASGEIPTEEGAALLNAIAATQSIKDASELQRRLAEIEAKLAALSGGAAPPPPALPPPGDTDASS